MNIFRYILPLSFFCFSYLTVVRGQGILLKQTNESGIYKKGQTIQVKLLANCEKNDSIWIIIRRNFGYQDSTKLVKYPGDTLVIYKETFGGPASLIIEAKSKTGTASIGAISETEQFKPVTKRPKDLDKFWQREKRALRALPLNAKVVPFPVVDNNYPCFDVELNCTSPKPVRGYFAKPKSARTKSLPIVVYFHAAGVNPSWSRSEPGNALRYAKMGKGALSFDLNAHGMLNGQPDAYYDQLDSGELKGYAQNGLENKQDIYFRGMYLRIIRTLDFLTKQPEWDGKRILVIGESQGGGQALAAAGLDHRVSAVVATVPAMCDWGGFLIGRKDSWPYPYSTKHDQDKLLSVLPYFDVAHLLKGSRATMVVEIGLIDQTCLSSAVYAAVNQAKGSKIILAVPYRAHHLTQAAFQKTWEKQVERTRQIFIENLLN